MLLFALSARADDGELARHFGEALTRVDAWSSRPRPAVPPPPVIPRGFHLVSETERVACYSRDPKERVDAKKVQKNLERFERLLGETVTVKVHYFHHEHAAEISAVTGRYASGVAYPETGVVHSTDKVHEHELVHLVSMKIGDPGKFFTEGLAVAFDEGGRWGGRKVKDVARGWLKANPQLRSLDRLSARFERLDENAAYPIAGSFMKPLVDKHGPRVVADFFRRSKTTPWKAAFREAFGVTAEQAEAAWLDDLGFDQAP